MIVVPMCVAQLFANTHIIQASRIRGQSIYYQVYLNDLDDGLGTNRQVHHTRSDGSNWRAQNQILNRRLNIASKHSTFDPM